MPRVRLRQWRTSLANMDASFVPVCLPSQQGSGLEDVFWPDKSTRGVKLGQGAVWPGKRAKGQKENWGEHSSPGPVVPLTIKHSLGAI